MSGKFSFLSRLSLPGSIVEDGRETAEYNAETGDYTLVFNSFSVFCLTLLECSQLVVEYVDNWRTFSMDVV